MAAKLTYQDVFNDEMAPEKFLPSPLYFSTGAINPVYSAPCGSLYVNTVTGGFFLNVSSPTPGTSWIELSNNNTSVEVGHHRSSTQTTATLSTGQYAPTSGDLVGSFGLGAWTNTGNLITTYLVNNTCGSTSATLNVGGTAISFIISETFDGITWALVGNLNVNRYNLKNGGGFVQSYGANIFGSTNGSVCMGGYDGTNALSSCELFNGTSWINGSANLPTSHSGMAATGTSYSGMIFGQDPISLSSLNIAARFNGAVWSANAFPIITPYAKEIECSASGSVNAAFINVNHASGFFNIQNAYGYNGNSPYVLTNIYNYSFVNVYTSGNSLMSYKYGGYDFSFPNNASKKTEIFNGVTFNNTTNDLNIARAGSQTKGPGNATQCMAAAGRVGNPPGSGLGLNSSEIYQETVVYKKLYPQYVKSFNQASLFLNNGVFSFLHLRAAQYISIYPANKYLVVNKNAITSIANQSDISGGYNILQVGASGSLAVYAISATPSLQIVPGTIAKVVSSGVNPLSANNTGVFVVKNIIVSSNTVVVLNPLVTSQNPGTGTMTLITTMLCVDYIGPDDIVIGSTDDNGILTIDKLFKTTNYISKTGF